MTKLKNYNTDIIIQRLGELKKLYTNYSSTLEEWIVFIQKYGYNEEYDKELKSFIYNYLFKNNIEIQSREPILSELSSVFSSIRHFHSIRIRTEFDNDSKKYKLFYYPEEYLSKLIEPKYKEFTDKFIDVLFSSDELILNIINRYEKTYDQCIIRINNSIKSKGLMPYCGTNDFMLERIKYITNCIKNLIESPYIPSDLKPIFIPKYNKANNILYNINEKIKDSNNYKENYLMIEKSYLEILEIENSLSVYMNQIWKNYLTNPSDYQVGQPYRYLMHVISSGYVEEDKINKLCTTLATDECSPLPSYGEYGYIVDFDIEQISTMSCEDSGSWIITMDDFIDRGLPATWQLHEQVSEDSYVFYEYPRLSKLILPWNIEQEMKKNNLNYKGVTTGRDAYFYSEIFVRRTNKPIKIIGYFAMTKKGLEEISKKLSSLGIDKPIIDLSYLYELENDKNKQIN